MSAIIFDLDGTLIDSAPDIHSNANLMLKQNGYDGALELATAKSFIGNGVPKFVERVMKHENIDFSKEMFEKLVNDFMKNNANDSISKTSIYPNVITTLINLKAQGYTLGICTNKAHSLTLQVLAGLGLEQYFSSIVCGDSLPTNKPDPAMLNASITELGEGKAIFIGDSEIDAATAKSANVPFILFTKGYLKIPIEEVYHSALFNNFCELEKKIQILVEQ